MSNTPTLQKLRAYPGTYLLKKIKKESTINLGREESKHIISGLVVDVGEPRVHDNGGLMKPVLAVGDLCFFINYGATEKYEEFEFEGETYYSVIFNDSRSFVKAKDL